MDEADKLEYTKKSIDIIYSNQLFSERRSSELADEFTRLEVQIATILLAFAGIFLNFFNDKLNGLHNIIKFIMRFTYASTVFFLILSLVLGLIHIKRKEKWWDELLKKRNTLLMKWKEVLGKEIIFEKAKYFHDGATSQEGNIVFSPKWTWLIQTVSLGIAFALFFLLFLVLLFNN